MVAGGVTDQGEVLASVEIFRLDSKSLGRAANMLSPRSFFSLVPVGLIRPRLLAIGGRNEASFIRKTEFYDEEENQWEEGPQLGAERSSFGAIMIEGKITCTENDSTTATCDLGRCPLQGEPEAPEIKPQATGWSMTNFLINI